MALRNKVRPGCVLSVIPLLRYSVPNSLLSSLLMSRLKFGPLSKIQTKLDGI